MNLFVLVAYLVLADGHLHSFELDSALTADDCAAAVEAGAPYAIPYEGQALDMSGAALVCEIDPAA